MFVGNCINEMPIFFQFHLNRGWTIPWCVHCVASLFFCRAGSCSSSPWIAWRGPRGLVFSFLSFTQYILTTHTLFKHRISKNQVSGPRLKRSYLIQNILFRTENGELKKLIMTKFFERLRRWSISLTAMVAEVSIGKSSLLWWWTR